MSSRPDQQFFDQARQMLADMDIDVIETHEQQRDELRIVSQTAALATIARLVAKYGIGHATLTIRSIAETGDNVRQLIAPVILGVSDVIAAHPEMAAAGARWLDAMDRVDLNEIVRLARANKQPVYNRQAADMRSAVATLVFIRLLPTFCEYADADERDRAARQKQTGPAKPVPGKRALAKARQHQRDTTATVSSDDPARPSRASARVRSYVHRVHHARPKVGATS